MKVLKPQPFLFEAGKRAVLLLHGFTSHTGDVRALGRFLQKEGYTCYAPLYSGHGGSPTELIATEPADWWQDVLAGYSYLKEKGYEEIAAAGLSLGGLFSLKLAYNVPLKGIVPMSTPMKVEGDGKLYKGVMNFARTYLKNEGKTVEEVEMEITSFKPQQMLNLLQQLNDKVRGNLHSVQCPSLIVQGRRDEMIAENSADIIFENLGTKRENKQIKWYENSGHAITLDEERQQLHEDILNFLQSLSWKQ